jgi:hypothetical protein
MLLSYQVGKQRVAYAIVFRRKCNAMQHNAMSKKSRSCSLSSFSYRNTPNGSFRKLAPSAAGRLPNGRHCTGLAHACKSFIISVMGFDLNANATQCYRMLRRSKRSALRNEVVCSSIFGPARRAHRKRGRSTPPCTHHKEAALHAPPFCSIINSRCTQQANSRRCSSFRRWWP